MSADPMKWWRDAIAGKHPPVTMEPQAGFYLVKAYGTMIPASILWEGPKDENGDLCGDQKLVAEIGGYCVDAEEQWLSMAKRPVSRAEYSLWLDKLMENI